MNDVITARGSSRITAEGDRMAVLRADVEEY